MAQALRHPQFKPFTSPVPSQARILIVDDELTSQFLLTDILEKVGYCVKAVSSGKKAFEYLQEVQPDIILLDIIMPGMDGFEVCRRLKEDARLQDIPVIFITALNNSDDIVRGFEEGAVDYLVKPFNPQEIKARMQTHLKLKKATDRLKHYSADLERIIEEETRELVKSERQAAFGQLIQGIVHNLKGPVTALLGSAQVGHLFMDKVSGQLQSGTPDREIIDNGVNNTIKSVENISMAGARLLEMINSLLVRGSSDRKYEVETIDLNKIIVDELKFLDGDLRFKHRITKKIDLADRPLLVRAVPSELAHLFTNLIRNSMDALHEQIRDDPSIEVSTRAVGNLARLRVSDNGCGIHQENLAKIFDPFFTTKPKSGESREAADTPTGTGLGLYTCVKTIQDMGGEIAVESKHGEGTHFTVNIPLAQPNPD